jgi:hypothetical protein
MKDDVNIEKEKLHKIADGLTPFDRVHFTIKDVPMDDGSRYQQVSIIIEKNIDIKDPLAIPEPPRFDFETNLPAFPSEFWKDDDES